MSRPFTQNMLNKLEQLAKVMGYTVQYEKGNFRTGACILKNNKIIVINKFSDLESKIASLSELIVSLEIDETVLENRYQELFCLLKQKNIPKQNL